MQLVLQKNTRRDIVRDTFLASKIRSNNKCQRYFFRETSENPSVKRVKTRIRSSFREKESRISDRSVSESGHTEFKFLEPTKTTQLAGELSHLRAVDVHGGGVRDAYEKLSSARRDVASRMPLYFKEIQILSDMKVRRVESAARWVVAGRIGGAPVGRRGGATHRKKKLTRLNCRANRISAFL